MYDLDKAAGEQASCFYCARDIAEFLNSSNCTSIDEFDANDYIMSIIENEQLTNGFYPSYNTAMDICRDNLELVEQVIREFGLTFKGSRFSDKIIELACFVFEEKTKERLFFDLENYIEFEAKSEIYYTHDLGFIVL